MKNCLLTAGACLAGLVASAPLATRQSTNIDAVVLQFALTLEHLENVFYKQALQKFTEAEFAAAGYGHTKYMNLMQIAYDEEQHVKLLSSALTAAGATPVSACTYNFPYTDVHGFLGLSSVLEGVGTSAYLGGAPLITSKEYLTVAGSILVTEALHTSYQRAAVKEVPFPTPYGTPLDPTSVFTLAAMFIVSCPANNTALPFKPFPTLTYMAGSAAPAAGATVTLEGKSEFPAGSYVTFVSGLQIVSVMGTVSGCSISAAIPAMVGGQTYVFATSADVEGTFDDTKVVAGPAIVEVAANTPTIDYGYYKS